MQINTENVSIAVIIYFIKLSLISIGNQLKKLFQESRTFVSNSGILY